MTPEAEKKQKFLAVLTVLFLFMLIGSLFYYIGVINRTRTDNLRNEVIRQKIEKEYAEKMNRINESNDPLPDIKAKSFLTIAIGDNDSKKILAEKNSNLTLPIASVTKLMVAIITLENINLDTNIQATIDYIGQEESAFVLETDRIYTAWELLNNALVSSDNDSARLLSSALGTDNFIKKMNDKARALGLTQTSYVNVTGLDPAEPTEAMNVSTANDLASLLIYIKNNYPQILRVGLQTEYNFCDINNYCKIVTATNKLLNNKNLQFRIIGGKTGSTDFSQKNLVLLTEIFNDVSLVNIVLGAEDNFSDSLSLINNVKITN